MLHSTSREIALCIMPVGTELRDNEATKLGRLPNLTTLVRITDRFFLLRRGFSDLGLAKGAWENHWRGMPRAGLANEL